MTVISLFDYDSLGSHAGEFQRAAVEIRSIGAAHAIEIGKRLIDLKQKAQHGTFSRWVTCELSMQMRTAQNMMSAARFVEGKSETLSHLPATILYKLASPSTETAIVNGVLDAASSGRPLDAAEIGARISVAEHAAREAFALTKRASPDRRKAKIEKHVAQQLSKQDAFVENDKLRRSQLRPVVAEIARLLPDKLKARLRQERHSVWRADLFNLLLEELQRPPTDVVNVSLVSLPADDEGDRI